MDDITKARKARLLKKLQAQIEIADRAHDLVDYIEKEQPANADELEKRLGELVKQMHVALGEIRDEIGKEKP